MILRKKKRVSAAELCWIVTENIRQIGSFPRKFTLAVVQDETVGWRVVVGSRSRFVMTPQLNRQLHQVEQELREAYTLAKD
jgi:predicted Zn-dependent protease